MAVMQHIQCSFVALSMVVAQGVMQLRRTSEYLPGRESAQGYNVALAFHGAYMRNQQLGGWKRQIKVEGSQVCSNFFVVEANIRKNIIKPLERDGANVKIYVDSYSRFDCTWRDEELRKRLQPVRIRMGNASDSPRVADSSIRVLRDVLEDKAIINYVVLLRFDVKYSIPIMSWNMTWDATYAAFRQAGHKAFGRHRFLEQEGIQFEDFVDEKEWRNWDACAMVSDLVFTMPISHVEPFIRAVEWSATNGTGGEHIGVGGPYEGKSTYCYHDLGTGHFVWQPFVQEMGAGSMRIMDQARGMASSDVGADCNAFLCIDRSCGDGYFDNCAE